MQRIEILSKDMQMIYGSKQNFSMERRRNMDVRVGNIAALRGVNDKKLNRFIRRHYRSSVKVETEVIEFRLLAKYEERRGHLTPNGVSKISESNAKDDLDQIITIDSRMAHGMEFCVADDPDSWPALIAYRHRSLTGDSASSWDFITMDELCSFSKPGDDWELLECIENGSEWQPTSSPKVPPNITWSDIVRVSRPLDQLKSQKPTISPQKVHRSKVVHIMPETVDEDDCTSGIRSAAALVYHDAYAEGMKDAAVRRRNYDSIRMRPCQISTREKRIGHKTEMRNRKRS